MLDRSVRSLGRRVRIVIAVLLGAAIALERQWRQRLAELRTNALVSIGAAAFVALSSLVPGESSPTRIAAQVAFGIGFLGTGVFLREGLNVRGLNTAATLWCSAGVGALAGSGFFSAGVITTAVVVTTNVPRPSATCLTSAPPQAVKLRRATP